MRVTASEPCVERARNVPKKRAALGSEYLCLECYRWLPHPLLSFLVSYFRHFSSLDSVVTQTHEGFLQGTNRFHLTSTPLVTMHNGTRAVGPGPGGTPSRGRSRCNWRRKPSCTSRRAYWRRRRESRAAVGAVGAVDAVCALGAGAAVVAEGVGGVERHPLARPPKGTQSKSLDAAVA